MPRPVLYDAGLRADLIRHAAAAIADGGVSHLSLRAVATAAGTSTNAVYTLFGGKDGLVEAAVATAAAGFTQAQRAVGVSADPLADLLGLGQAYRSWAVKHPALYAVMFGGRVTIPPLEVPGEDCDEAAEGINPLAAVVLRLIDTGEFGGAAPSQIAETIWASVHGVVSLEIALWCDRDEATRAALYQTQLDAIVRAWSTHTP